MCPWRPARPCPVAGCPRLLRPGERCPEHAPAPFADSTYRRRPPIPAALREQILKRDAYICQVCGAPATDVDHIVPRSAGGTDHPLNLQALCGNHHRRKTGRDAARARWARKR